jgi:hypothetical protein
MKNKLSLLRIGAVRRFCRALELLALGAICLAACTPTPTPTPVPLTIVVDFEDPPLGTVYHVPDAFTDSGVTIIVQHFQWSTGDWTDGGLAEIGSEGRASGSGQEIGVNNVNLDFEFGCPLRKLSLAFGEYGGNLNVEINGEFHNFGDFADKNGATIGGVAVAIVNGHGNDTGTLELSGAITSFSIGGQELWIDDVRLEYSP